MDGNKYSIARLKRLCSMLKENRYPNFPRFLEAMKHLDAAGAYKLSARTLQRDVAFLKSEYRAPIRYDYTRKGYYLTNPAWSVDIPLLEGHEMKAAVLGARLAEDIMPAPVKQEMRSAVDSLLAANEKGVASETVLLSLVAKGSKAVIRPEVFRVIFDNWQAHRQVAFSYAPVEGREVRYWMEPHVLAFYEGNWYVKGYVLAKNDAALTPERKAIPYVFALHRISEAESVKGLFVPDADLIAAVNEQGPFVFPQIQDVRMRLSHEAYKFLGEQFEFTDEGMEGEFHLVRIPSASQYRIVNFVLVEGGEAKLLNHPEVRREVIRRAQRCIAVAEGKENSGKI